MINKKITITTCQRYPELPSNLKPLVNALSIIFPVKIIPWQQVRQSDLILPLCAWDYSEQPDAFRQWLNQMQQQGSIFLNSVKLMQWNMDKRYLVDLERRGVDVIPSQILPADARLITQAIEKEGWQQAVIKPAIGQSGRFVQKICKNQPLAELENYTSDVVLQPYIPEVASNGETSLIFFSGEFSHAIRRQPPQNEWRANSAYGVQISTQVVNQAIIQQAQNVLTKLPEMPQYARVDGTIIGSRFLVNELELIEPALYLDRFPNAIQYFVDVVKTKI